MAGSNGHDFRNLLTSQPMPHSLEAEQRLLGIVLDNPNRFVDVSSSLSGEDLYYESHRVIWEGIGELKREGQTHDTLTLADYLDSKGTLDKIRDENGLYNGLSYLEYLVDTAVGGRNLANQYARIVSDHAARRKLAENSYKVAYNAITGTHTVDELIDQIRGSMNQIIEQHQSKEFAMTVSQIESKQLQWLWENRIPRGMITMLDGDPGLGKSLITVDLATRISCAEPMPDGSPGLSEPGTTLLLSAEDDPEVTVRPRLEIAGAALDRIRLGRIDQCWSLEQIAVLEQEIIQNDVRLVIIDPLMAYLPADTNSYRDQDIRTVLKPLAALAADTNVAVVLVRHLTKSGGSNPLYRGGGSIGIIGAARSGIMVSKHPEKEEVAVLSMTKSNLATKASSLGYQIKIEDDLPRIVWTGKVDDSAEELLESAEMGSEDRNELAQACRWLRDLLMSEGNAMPVKELNKQARAVDISKRTLKRARGRLNVQAYRPKIPGPWWIRLPKS